MHFASRIAVTTRGFSDVVEITESVEAIIADSGIKDGLVCVFVPGSTASVTTIEYEDGAIHDLKDAIEEIAPFDKPYRHDKRWGDGNGFSHVRAALLKPGITVPLVKGDMTLGTWQQIILIDFDNNKRKRSVVVQILGE